MSARAQAGRIAELLGLTTHSEGDRTRLTDPVFDFTILEWQGDAAPASTIDKNRLLRYLLPLMGPEPEMFSELHRRLTLPEIDDAAHDFLKRHEEDKALLAQILSLPRPAYADRDFSAAASAEVTQRQIGISHAGSPRYIEFTAGLSPCLAVTLYNPRTRAGALAHVDDKTDLASLREGISLLQAPPYRKLQATITGGTAHESEELLLRLARFLRGHADIEITGVDAMRPQSPRLVALDCRTGVLIPGRFPEGYIPVERSMDHLREDTSLTHAHAPGLPQPGAYKPAQRW